MNGREGIEANKLVVGRRISGNPCCLNMEVCLEGFENSLRSAIKLSDNFG